MIGNNGKIGYKIDEPDRFEIEGAGYIDYFEFENTIWINDIFSEKRGEGTRLARAFIRYAKKQGKSIYGRANPSGDMKLNRLIRWYSSFGATPIYMRDNPNAMKLEI